MFQCIALCWKYQGELKERFADGSQTDGFPAAGHEESGLGIRCEPNHGPDAHQEQEDDLGASAEAGPPGRPVQVLVEGSSS